MTNNEITFLPHKMADCNCHSKVNKTCYHICTTGDCLANDS